MKRYIFILIAVATLILGLTAMFDRPEPGDRSFTRFWASAAGVAWAQPPDVWFEADQVTIGWTPVTTLEDGSPVPEGDIINYTIHLMEESSGATMVVESVVMGPPYTITLPGEGGYRVGVQTVRLYAGYAAEAPISWSNDGSVTLDGIPFGVLRVRLPAKAKGMFKQ